ncbi:MAG TPA: redoxin domain-containing protein [Candidatus Obscuribacterales bacterium]
MSTAQKSAPIARYVMLAVVMVGLGALVYTLASRLERPQSQQAQQSQAPPAEDSGSLEGKIAPAFALQNLKGQTISLAQHRGKVVFLNFWATWCEPCLKELPSMLRLYEKLKGQPIEILAVSLVKDPAQDVPAFEARTKLNLSFPILAETTDQKVSKQLYKTTGVPESFIIGPDGQVIKHAIGAYEWDSPQIVQYLDSLLKDVKSVKAPAQDSQS